MATPAMSPIATAGLADLKSSPSSLASSMALTALNKPGMRLTTDPIKKR